MAIETNKWVSIGETKRFADIIDQNQTAQNVWSDLDTIPSIFSITAA